MVVILDRAFRCAALFAALSCCATPLAAQLATGQTYVVDHWNTENGLPQNTVDALLQTPDGYLWIATNGGLVRFDGVTFTAYTAARYAGIRSDRDKSLCRTPDGAIWIGTEDGLTRMADGAFRTFGVADGLPPGQVLAVSCAPNGAVWMALDNQGAARWQDGRITVYRDGRGLGGKAIPGVVSDHAGGAWFDVWQSHTGWLRPADSNLVLRPGDAPAPDIDATFGLGRDSASMLFRTRDGYAVVSAFGHGHMRRVTLPENVRRRGVFNVLEASDGDHWVVVGGGVVLIPRQGPVQWYLLPAGSGATRALLVDRDGIVWIGSDAGGLFRLRPRLFTVLGKAEGLSSDLPMGIGGDAQGRVYIGSNCDGITVLDHGRPTIYNAHFPLAGCLWSVLPAPDGTVWIGTWGGGLVEWRGRYTRQWSAPRWAPDGVVLSLMRDHAGQLWAGTLNGGVARYHGEHFVVWDTAGGLPSNDVRTIIETRDHTVWVGTSGGAARLSGDRFTPFTPAAGLPRGQIRAIYEDADSALWFGSYGGGMARYKHGVFKTITSANGLVEDVASAIIEDNYGYFWTSGNRGVSRVARRELDAFADGLTPAVHAVLYGKADGMINAETNGGFSPEAWKAPDGRIWFPTLQGVAIVDPARIGTGGRPPGVLIEGASVDGQARDLRRPLALSPQDHDLDIAFTGLSSAAPEQILFRYRLSGVDTGWVNVGTRRHVYFARLPAGAYAFTVTAANREGLWNPAGATLTFAVQPPLAETWWFRVTLAALLIGGVALAVRARILALRRQAATQREFSRRVLDGQEQERRRIAAELHDSVGQSLLVMKNRAELGLRARDVTPAARDQLAQISAVASETLAETRAIAHNLRPYQLDRLGLAAAVRNAVERASDGSGIRFTVDADGVDGLLAPDAEISLYRIVQEAVNNVLKHSAAKEARILLRHDHGAIRLTVTDDGRGTASGAGFGLSGIAQRVQMLAGRHEFHSAPGAGTTLVVSVPVRSAPA